MNSPVCNLPHQAREVRRLSGNSGFLRTIAAIVAAGGLLAAPASVSAFWEVARGELILHTTGRATYDSNVFARTDAEGDLYFSLIPELQFLRKAGLGTIDARAGVDITRFVDFTAENNEDFFASLDVSYPVRRGSPLSGGFSSSFTQRSGVNEYLNARVREEAFSVGLNTIYRFSERLGLRNNLAYNRNNVQIFNDVEAYSGTLGFQWAYSKTLAFFTDYRIRRSRSLGDDGAGGNVDNLDHAVFFGATGKLAPRLEGSASAGVQRSDARGSGASRNLFVTAAELAWALRPQTNLTLGLSRDVDVSPADQSVEASTISLGMDHRIEPKILLNGYVGYRDHSFSGGASRDDQTFLTGAGMTYTFTRYWRAGLNYDYTDNDSSAGFADYRRHRTRIFTRYSF